jgi:hypothetical protein
MRGAFELWRWPDGTVRGERVGVFETIDAAIAFAGVPNSEWVVTTTHPGHWYVPLPDGARTGRYQSWVVSPVRVPESDADRIELALEIALEDGQTDGDHHKLWVIDQIVRVLTGDRYEQVITEYCAGEDGPETYFWETGIAP